MFPSSFFFCFSLSCCHLQWRNVWMSQLRRGGQFKSGGYLGAESYFGCSPLLQNLDRYKICFSFASNSTWNIMQTFDSATTLTVCEGYDVTKQEHYFKKGCSCCDCCHRRCSFRVWQVLLFLFVIAVIIAGLALIIAFFEDGKIPTKLCAIKKADSPGDTGKHVSLVRR